MSNIILEMNHITKEFPGIKALDNINFKVERGEIHAICGENGAGKSTLMNVLSGVYPYGSFEGEIVYNGEICEFHNIRDSEKKGIVIIHQELALSPNLSIAENVFLGNEVTSHKGIIDWTQTMQKAKEMLSVVGLENENLEAAVSSLGVGKQQLIEIVKALTKDVELLILDEPTASLNDEESLNLLNIILGLKEKGITCIIISHKLNELEYVADNITILRDGKTIETLNKDEEGFDENRIIKGMVGRELTNRYPPFENNAKEVVFEVKDWNVYHPDDGNRQVLKDISFNVRAGEVVGFAGLMGAGRTELAMSIFGKSYGQKISGQIYKEGEELNLKDVKDAIEHKIAYVPEDRKTAGLIGMHDIKVNMTLPALKNFFSKNSVIDQKNEIKVSKKYKDLINIRARSIEQEAGSLSGGNQQKVVLAKWMITEPDILILDEPTRGIDVGAKYEIYNIINELSREGKAIIFISSEMPEIIGMCDRVYVLNEGEIVGELYRDDLSQENIMTHIVSHNRRENNEK